MRAIVTLWHAELAFCLAWARAAARDFLMYRENKNPFCQENSEPLDSTSARRTWVEKDLYLPGNTLKAKVYPG